MMMSARTAGAAPQGAHRYELESGLGRLTPAECAARGKAARAAVPRDSHAAFDPGPDRRQGQRVVAGQRLTQASSDIFLGWQRTEAGLDGKQRDFYGRQLRDWKYSIVTEDLVPHGMRTHGEICGWTLVRAHARSGDRIAVAAYLGGSDVFDQAIT